MLGLMSSPGTTRRQVFRQRSSLLLAAVCAATGVTLLLSLARNWSSFPRPVFAARVVLGLALTWAIFVRPAVLLDDRGVTLRNVLRDVHIPWGRLTHVTSRWNVKVFAGDQGYNAWAISSQVERPRPVSSGVASLRSAGLPKATSAPRAPHPGVVTKVTAHSVADSIRIARQEYVEALALGRLPGSATGSGGLPADEASADEIVRIRWVPMVIVVLSASAIAVLGLIYLG